MRLVLAALLFLQAPMPPEQATPSCTQALGAAGLFFLHSLSPDETVAVLSAFPAFPSTPRRAFLTRSFTQSVSFAVFALRGRVLGWSKDRWVYEACLKMNHERLSTMEHELRSMQLMEGFAAYLGWTPQDTEDAKFAAALHDLGKLVIPLAIIEAPRQLTPEEYTLIKRHVEWGARFVKWMPGFERLAPIIMAHHEFHDGTGYPFGWRGPHIPKIAKALAIIDSYDAMTEDRYYRPGRTQEEALKEIMRCAGLQFDPQTADRFYDWIKSRGPQGSTLPTYWDGFEKPHTRWFFDLFGRPVRDRPNGRTIGRSA